MTKAQEIADIIIGEMFAPHELPLDDKLAGLYLAIADKVLAALPQTSKQRQPGDEVVYFNGRLVTWAEVEAAVQEWKCSHTRPTREGQ